jgi:hypothetical protein
METGSTTHLFDTPAVSLSSRQRDDISIRRGKTVIVGAGAVGTTLLCNLSLKAVVTGAVPIDLDHQHTEAEIQDVEQPQLENAIPHNYN